MNNINIVGLHNIIEEESQYLKFLKERYLDQKRFQKLTDDIKLGFQLLDFPKELSKIFENLNLFLIWLG
ncbi:MAG: hypothetical protein ABIL44_11485, partial [candidate division WOR-3 bacterium]